MVIGILIKFFLMVYIVPIVVVSEIGKIRISLLRKVMKRNGALLYPAKAAVAKRSLEVALTEDDFSFPFPTITIALGTESI